ncbi:hypothetical protein SAMN05421595_2603 [Austwickia chelonae]|uniref:Uncharacterized protein n=1 Tax=Austwickia chelonae NBRC 105200 TaxID=1184607 RepID=K6VRA9_9MICO|nr:hypothetical protein [Austwickia chelonae]GAB79294.1 hypothetical protein AUCHE_22_00640 [Austwickia chelonae NBRC 105200]SEW37997.1 hypothetical protein SAMN05421595_2603 [Austwickia chelonae]
MIRRSSFRKLFAIAATGALAFSLAPAAAQASSPEFEEVKKIIKASEEKYGNVQFARFALAYSEDFKKKHPKYHAQAWDECQKNHHCKNAHQFRLVPPNEKIAIDRMHTTITEMCAKMTRDPKSGVGFKKYKFEPISSKFILEKKGVIQTNNTQKELTLTLRNAETYTKTNTIGWNVEASASIKGIVNVKAAFQNTWAFAYGSTTESWRAITAKPGESFRLDKGHQEVTGKVTGVFETDTHNPGDQWLCNRLPAKETQITIGQNASEVVNQVNTGGMIIREAPKVEAQRAPKQA